MSSLDDSNNFLISEKIYDFSNTASTTNANDHIARSFTQNNSSNNFSGWIFITERYKGIEDFSVLPHLPRKFIKSLKSLCMNLITQIDNLDIFLKYKKIPIPFTSLGLLFIQSLYESIIRHQAIHSYHHPLRSLNAGLLCHPFVFHDLKDMMSLVNILVNYHPLLKDSLTFLNLSDINFSHSLCPSMNRLMQLSYLTKLSLVNCQLTDAHIGKLNVLKNLIYLDLSWNTALSKSGFMDLIRPTKYVPFAGLSNLKYLVLIGLPLLCEKIILELLLLPSLEEIDISFTSLATSLKKEIFASSDNFSGSPLKSYSFINIVKKHFEIQLKRSIQFKNLVNASSSSSTNFSVRCPYSLFDYVNEWIFWHGTLKTHFKSVQIPPVDNSFDQESDSDENDTDSEEKENRVDSFPQKSNSSFIKNDHPPDNDNLNIYDHSRSTKRVIRETIENNQISTNASSEKKNSKDQSFLPSVSTPSVTETDLSGPSFVARKKGLLKIKENIIHELEDVFNESNPIRLNEETSRIMSSKSSRKQKEERHSQSKEAFNSSKLSYSHSSFVHSLNYKDLDLNIPSSSHRYIHSVSSKNCESVLTSKEEEDLLKNKVRSSNGKCILKRKSFARSTIISRNEKDRLEESFQRQINQKRGGIWLSSWNGKRPNLSCDYLNQMETPETDLSSQLKNTDTLIKDISTLKQRDYLDNYNFSSIYNISTSSMKNEVVEDGKRFCFSFTENENEHQSFSEKKGTNINSNSNNNATMTIRKDPNFLLSIIMKKDKSKETIRSNSYPTMKSDSNYDKISESYPASVVSSISSTKSNGSNLNNYDRMGESSLLMKDSRSLTKKAGYCEKDEKDRIPNEERSPEEKNPTSNNRYRQNYHSMASFIDHNSNPSTAKDMQTSLSKFFAKHS